jgi:hypothetical protein
VAFNLKSTVNYFEKEIINQAKTKPFAAPEPPKFYPLPNPKQPLTQLM